jgi:hypothetical protein
MIYEIVFQYMPKDITEPAGDSVWTVNTTNEAGTPLLPSVGDIVGIDHLADNGQPLQFTGEVISRHFRYERTEGDTKCIIIIIAAETKRSTGSV